MTDPIGVALGMIAGLALFLYGVSRLATSMRAVAGDRMRQVLARATTNRFAGVATGAVATAVLDSWRHGGTAVSAWGSCSSVSRTSAPRWSRSRRARGSPGG